MKRRGCFWIVALTVIVVFYAAMSRGRPATGGVTRIPNQQTMSAGGTALAAATQRAAGATNSVATQTARAEAAANSTITVIPTVIAVVTVDDPTRSSDDVTQSPSPTNTPFSSPTRRATATFRPTLTRQPTRAATATRTEDETAARIESGLSLVAGGRDVRSVVVADGRDNGGTRGVIIAYVTTETTSAGMAEEAFDLLSGVASSIRANDLDLDEVTLVVGDANGNAIGTIVAQTADLMAWIDGDITRAELVERMIFTDF